MYTRIAQVTLTLALLVVPATCGSPNPPPGAPQVGGCSVFPASNPWNQDISKLPVAASSDAYVREIDG